MTSAAFAVAASLLLGGLAAPVLAAEPVPRSGSSATAAAELDIAQEQSHLQTVSASYSVQVADDDNLPLQFRGSERPKGQKLLNLSF